jgi:autoinducer 2-degrading protein
MQIVHVFIDVHPDQIEAFRDATIANARASRKEAGVLRFDILQEESDPTRFLLVEIYKDAEAPALHRQTAHYATWRDRVAPMMAQPRSSVRYVDLLPSYEL